MPKPKKPSGGGVPTNYGYFYLSDGTYVSFLLQPDGTGIVQTPESLKGKTCAKVDGKWVLV